MAAPTVYGRVTGVIAAGGRVRVAGVGWRGKIGEAAMTTLTTLYYLRDQRGRIHLCDDEGAMCNVDMTGAVQLADIAEASDYRKMCTECAKFSQPFWGFTRDKLVGGGL